MGIRNIALTEKQTALIDQWIATGRYQHVAEILQAALELLEREEADSCDLRGRLTAGLNQARRRDLADGSGEETIRRAFVG